MSRDIVPSSTTLDEHLQTIDADSKQLIAASLAKNTRRAYKSDWAHFLAFCEKHSLSPLPAAESTVRWYITDLAHSGRKVSTIERRLAAIAQAHKVAGYPSPTHSTSVRLCFRGIRREFGEPPHKKRPVFTPDVRLMIQNLPDDIWGCRNRALILLGFAGSFRRSELVFLDVEDLEMVHDGIVVTLRKSKTDQDWTGRTVGIPYGSHPITCPVRAVEEWLEVSGIESGPLFRPIRNNGMIVPKRLSDRSVALIIKRAAEAAGMNPKVYAGHSLRSGHITQAAMNGAPERRIMDQSGHKSVITLRSYIRDGKLFHDNSAAYLGL